MVELDLKLNIVINLKSNKIPSMFSSNSETKDSELLETIEEKLSTLWIPFDSTKIKEKNENL